VLLGLVWFCGVMMEALCSRLVGRCGFAHQRWNQSYLRSFEGVSKVLEGSAESIIIETDCLELIHLIKARSRDSSSLGHLVADLKDLLSSS
jgi:hypothetical protein